MGSVNESDPSEPLKPQSDGIDMAAAEITIEPADQPTHRRLDDDRAPVLYVPATRPRFGRAAILAVAIALSAAAGSAVGAIAAVAFAPQQPASSEDAHIVEVNALRGIITQLTGEVASLKASIESNTKAANAQMAKVAERVERAEKAQAEPASRVAKLSELLERLDKRNAASPEITGSIAPKQRDRAPVVSGWVLREVFNGRAMVENDRMGLFEAVPGANLPGLGRVQTIRRQDGRWVVVTPRGFIVAQR